MHRPARPSTPARAIPLVGGAPPTGPALAAAVAAVVAAVLIAVATAALAHPGRSDVPSGGVLSARDRADLHATPVLRGSDPPPADPTVDRSDPTEVARAYLAAAYSAGPDDADATERRGSSYAEPGSAAAAVGIVVLDPPPPGSLRTAAVTGLELDAASSAGDRRGYRAELGTATGPPGAPGAATFVQVHVALARGPDGHWLVTSDSADLPAGED